MRVDLICVDRKQSRRDWEIKSSDTRVIEVPNCALLQAAFRGGVHEFGRDIRRVIFDGSGDVAFFLQFLTELPVDYRGDIVMIQPDGRAFLSAPATRGDGRILFALAEQDLDFYLAAAYAPPSPNLSVSEWNLLKNHAA